MLTAASVWTYCKTTGAPSTTCRRCSPPSSRCSATPTQTRQPTPRRRGCTPSAGACASLPRQRTVADFAPAADASTTSVCRHAARLVPCCSPRLTHFALRRRLWSNLGRCHDHRSLGRMARCIRVDVVACKKGKKSLESRRVSWIRWSAPARRGKHNTPSPSLSASARRDSRARAPDSAQHRRRGTDSLLQCAQSCCRVPLLPASRRRCLVAHAEGRWLHQPWCVRGE